MYTQVDIRAKVRKISSFRLISLKSTSNSPTRDLSGTIRSLTPPLRSATVQLEKQEAEVEIKAAITNDDTQAFRRAKISLERAINMISVSKNHSN